MSAAVAALIEANRARDLCDPWAFSPGGRLSMVRVQRLFEAEARVSRTQPVIRVNNITGTKEVLFPVTYTPPAAETFPCDEIAIYDLGDTVRAVDFPHYAAMARANLLAAQIGKPTEEQINIEAMLAAQECGPILAGPGLDDSQLTESGAVGEFADYFDGEADFKQIVRSETGRIMSVAAAAKRWNSFRLQCEQTERLAEALESTGWKVRCVDPATAGQGHEEGRPVRPAMTFIPVGQPELAITMPNVQRLNGFPTVAASRRSEMVRSLRYYLDRQPFARMATLTSGPRQRPEARLENLHDESMRFHAAVGELVRSRFFKRHASAIFLGMEFGTPELIGDDNETGKFDLLAHWHLHHHGHLVYVPKRWKLGNRKTLWTKDQWARLRRWMRLKLAGLMRYDWKAEGFSWNERERGIWEKDAVHCELGKTLEKVEEVCKYPFKGADLDVLLEKAGPWAVRTYFEQVKGLRLATPYGELRTLRRDVKDSGKRFVITSTPEGKVVSIKRNWNLGRYDFYIRKKRAMERARTRRALRPEVIAANHARSLRSFAKKIRRPLWRLFKLSEKAKRAADGIQSGEKLVYWNAVATALEIEKREHFRFLRDIIETLPRQMQASGLNDYIAAPWLADFREYLSRTKAACETGAATPSQIEEENAKQTTKKGEESTPKQPPRNRMIARCAPFASGKWRISQPVFCVVGYTGQFGQLESQTPAVAELAQLTRSHIAAALATQANVDAAPIRASAQAPARKTLPGSHYPHNSQGGGDDFAPEPEFWAFEALELAELAGRN